MAKPQLEDGYTQIANEILERLVRMNLAPNQWRVLLLIIRKTYGFHKKVDYIANFQIVEATGLCKAVVSRCLKALNDLELITRKGKYIGFQKDWERWGKLAIPSTLDTKLAEQSTSEKVSNIAEGLAEQSTKVSSCAVTQKIKDTITKHTTSSTEKQKVEFNEFIEELRPQYPELDFDNELQKFRLYWSEGGRKLKRPKLALKNWMDKAREFKQEGKGGKHRPSRGVKRSDDPDRYIKGKYGHVVNR